MTGDNLAESSGQVGNKDDWLKRSGKLGIINNFHHYLPILLSTNILLSAMSPSSVCNNGIKGVDTGALSHLGPNVGKPIRRYGFASLLFIAAQLTFVRPRYYQEIQRCVDFFHKLVFIELICL